MSDSTEPIGGVGIDLVEIKRVENLVARWGLRFLEKVFFPSEIAYCQAKPYPAQHYAARLAIKEAVLKALGEGWTERAGWKDIAVSRGVKGQPGVKLVGKGEKLGREKGIGKILVSLSHSQGFAVAAAITLISSRTAGER